MNLSPPDKPETQAPPLICHVLQAFAVAIAVTAVVAFFVALADISKLPDGFPGTGRIILAGIAFLVCGLSASAAMVGLSAIVAHLSKANAVLMQLGQDRLPGPEHGPQPGEGARAQALPPPAAGLDKAQFEAIQRLLEEVRDNVLLTDEERRTKRQRLAAMERRERTAQIQQALEAGRFQDARARLLELERRIGGDEDTRQLAEHIEAAAAKAEGEDVAAATKQVEDLMSLTSWDRAIKIGEDLIDRHPNSLPARQLLGSGSRRCSWRANSSRRTRTRSRRSPCGRRWRR
jgi:hypothetical protein